MLLTHNFPKPHEHDILNTELDAQCCSVGTCFELLEK